MQSAMCSCAQSRWLAGEFLDGHGAEEMLLGHRASPCTRTSSLICLAASIRGAQYLSLRHMRRVLHVLILTDRACWLPVSTPATPSTWPTASTPPATSLRKSKDFCVAVEWRTRGEDWEWTGVKSATQTGVFAAVSCGESRIGGGDVIVK